MLFRSTSLSTTYQSRFHRREELQPLVGILKELQDKKKELKAEGARLGESSLAHKKYVIISKILKSINDVIDSFNRQSSLGLESREDEMKAVLTFLKSIVASIEAVITLDEVEILASQRNYNKILNNVVFFYGSRVAVYMAAGALFGPLSPLGVLAAVAGAHVAGEASSGLLGMNDFQSATIKIIIRLIAFLTSTHLDLTLRYDTPHHYEELGLSMDASQQEIKRAYFNLSRVHHPDKGGEAEVFNRIANAYKVLSDTESKQAYDKQLEASLAKRAECAPTFKPYRR